MQAGSVETQKKGRGVLRKMSEKKLGLHWWCKEEVCEGTGAKITVHK